MADDRQELEELRRLDELERRASGTSLPPKTAETYQEYKSNPAYNPRIPEVGMAPSPKADLLTKLITPQESAREAKYQSITGQKAPPAPNTGDINPVTAAMFGQGIPVGRLAQTAIGGLGGVASEASAPGPKDESVGDYAKRLATGGAIGAGTSLAMQGVGSALQKGGEYAFGHAAGIPQRGAKLAEEIPAGTASGMLKNATNKIKEVVSERSDVAKNMSPINASDIKAKIVQEASQHFDSNGDVIPGSENTVRAYDKYLRYLHSQGPAVSAEDLQALNSRAGKVAYKPTGDVRGQAQAEAAKVVHDVTGDALSGASPKMAETNDRLTTLYRAKNNLEKKGLSVEDKLRTLLMGAAAIHGGIKNGIPGAITEASSAGALTTPLAKSVGGKALIGASRLPQNQLVQASTIDQLIKAKKK